MVQPISPEQVSSEAALLPIHEITAFLQEHLGQRMTAYIGGVKDPKMVARWISARICPATSRRCGYERATRRRACSSTPTATRRRRRGCSDRTSSLATRRRPTCCARRVAGRSSARSSRRRARSHAPSPALPLRCSAAEAVPTWYQPARFAGARARRPRRRRGDSPRARCLHGPRRSCARSTRPRPDPAARRRLVRSREALERLAEELRREARALVADMQLDGRSSPARREGHFAARRSEARCRRGSRAPARA